MLLRSCIYLVRKRGERQPSGEEGRWSGRVNTEGILRRRFFLSLSLSLSSSGIRSDGNELRGGATGQGEAAPSSCCRGDGLPEVQREKRLRAGQTPLQGHCTSGAERGFFFPLTKLYLQARAGKNTLIGLDLFTHYGTFGTKTVSCETKAWIQTAVFFADLSNSTLILLFNQNPNLDV